MEHIIGVTNGSLHILEGTVTFHSDKSQNNISMKVPYNDTYSWEHDDIRACMKWMGQVFTDFEMMHYFLKYCASCLCNNNNNDQTISVWIGKGSNSKTMLMKLFEATFKTIKLDHDLISTTTSASSDHFQKIMNLLCQVRFFTEYDSELVIDTKVVQHISSPGSPKLIFICNRLPEFSDDGFIQNTVLLPFLSTWVHKASKDEILQYSERKFQIDPYFRKQIPKLAPAFLWILVQYYPEFYKEGLVRPKCLIQYLT